MATRRGCFPQISDEELVVGALLGDLGAFDELVRRFRGAVIAVAEQALGSREAALDVAQEAMLTAFKALPQLDDPSRFAGWLCSIAKHQAWRTARRDRRSEPTEPSELDALIVACSSELASHPAEDLERQLEGDRVRGALAELAPEHRIVMLLYYYEEWSVGEIAAFLSLPATTVKWRLHQGRKSMRRRLEALAEEDDRERKQLERQRDPADPAPAAGDRADCAGGQPDRKPHPGRAQFRAAIQPGVAAP